MTYVKILSAQSLDYAPSSGNFDNTFYSPIPEDVLRANGYLPYEATIMPEVAEMDKHAEFEYKIIDSIITEVWSIVNDDNATICARLRQYLNDTDKYFIQWQEGDKTDEEYEPYKIARQAARERIRELEN